MSSSSVEVKKVCSKCGKEKCSTEFNKASGQKGGLNRKCRVCYNNYQNSYRKDNREKIRLREKAYENRNKGKRRDINKKHYYAHYGKNRARSKVYRDANKEEVRLRNKDYYHRVTKNCPKWKARRAFYRIIRKVLEGTKYKKISSSEELLGYSHEDLRKRLEVNFDKGMTWSNHGTHWHIDHTIPIAAFISKGVINPRTINALCNLKPMWARENMSKGGKRAINLK